MPPADGNNRFEWTMVAERLVLNWTNATRVEVAHPQNLSQAYASVAKGAPQFGRADFADVVLESRSRSADSNLLARRTDLSPLYLSAQLDQIRVQPLRVDTLDAGSNAGWTSPYPEENATNVHYRPPPHQVGATAIGRSYAVQGNLSLVVWDAVLSLSSRDSKATIETGTTLRSVYPNPTGLPAPVRERDYRLITLYATNASLYVQTASTEATLALDGISVQGTANATFSAAEGVVRVGKSSAVLDDALSVSGRLRLDAWTAAAIDPRLHGFLSGREIKHLEDGSGALLLEASLPPGPNSRSPLGEVWPWIIALMGGALVGAFAVRRRRREIRIEDAEWALLQGRSAKGYRLARRLVARNPSDPDALFLLGSALLSRGEPEKALVALEPLAKNVTPSRRRGIAFVLAVAARSQGDRARARRWAREAAEEPTLLARLREDGFGDLLPPRRRTAVAVQSGYS